MGARLSSKHMRVETSKQLLSEPREKNWIISATSSIPYDPPCDREALRRGWKSMLS